MNHPHGAARGNRLVSAVVSVAVVTALGGTSGCAGDQAAAPAQEPVAPDPAAKRALDQTALAVAEAFADRDRGGEERAEGWLSQLRGDFESAAGVQVGHGETADDGLVLLTHAATSTYKCIAVTAAADVAGEPVEIARISVEQPRC